MSKHALVFILKPYIIKKPQLILVLLKNFSFITSSEFTLRTMAVVSLFIPFVLAYIVYAWWSIDKKKLDKDELKEGGHAY